jgi:hypothetical protein
VLAAFHYFWGDKSVKTCEISNHTHLLLAAAIGSMLYEVIRHFEEASYVLYLTLIIRQEFDNNENNQYPGIRRIYGA